MCSKKFLDEYENGENGENGETGRIENSRKWGK